jgi:hypothetical protein
LVLGKIRMGLFGGIDFRIQNPHLCHLAIKVHQNLPNSRFLEYSPKSIMFGRQLDSGFRILVIQTHQNYYIITRTCNEET